MTAARSGQRVILFDDQPSLGGVQEYNPTASPGLVSSLCADLRTTDARICLSTCVTGIFGDHSLTALSSNALLRVRAGRIVLATGAEEQLAVFRNNDLPGIMLGSAALRLMYCYGVRPGRCAVVLAADDEAYRVASILSEAGVEVRALADLREGALNSTLADSLRRRGIELLTRHGPVAAHEARGNMHVQALSVAPLQPDGNTHAARARTFACDLVTVSVGRSPSLALAAQAGASVGYDSSVGASVVRQCPAGIRVAGAAALCGDDDDALASGRAAGADVEHKPVFCSRAERGCPQWCSHIRKAKSSLISTRTYKSVTFLIPSRMATSTLSLSNVFRPPEWVPRRANTRPCRSWRSFRQRPD